MKLKKTKLLSLIMAAALVFESAGMNVVAATNTVNTDATPNMSIEVLDVSMGDVSENDVTAGDVSENEVASVEDVTNGDVSEGNVAPVEDVTNGDVTTGDVSEGDVSTEDVSEGDVTTGDVSEGDVTGGDVSEGDVSTGDVSEGDVTTGDVTGGDVSEGDVTTGDVTDGDVTGGDVTTGDVTDGDVSEGDVSTGDVVEALFPGLPTGYALSAEQMEAKAVLSEYASDIAELEVTDSDAYVKGQLIYLTESEEEAQMVADAYGAVLESFSYGVAVIRLTENRTVTQAVLAAANPATMLPAVWPNYIGEFYGKPNDPALDDTNADAYYQWQHKFVGSFTAWDAGYTGKDIKVAVLDSGALSAHEEFTGSIVKNVSINETGTVVTDATTDINGHGTHVTGIIGANQNNGKGGSGIAPDASLYVYGVGDAKGEGYIYTDAWIRALNMAAKEDKVDVVNMSFGFKYYSGASDAAIQDAYKNYGLAIFAAAGNDTANTKAYPACYDNVCSIASLQEDGKKSSFTTYNDQVDLAFPGSNIYSTYKGDTSSYDVLSGTSMACPVAAGVAAVILSGAADIPELAGKTGAARVDALFSVMENAAFKCSSPGTGAGTTFLPTVFGLTVDDWYVVPEAPTFEFENGHVFDSTGEYIDIKSATTTGVDIYYNMYGKTPTFKNGDVINGYYYDSYDEEYGLWVSGQKKVTIKAIAVNHYTGKASKVSTVTYSFKPNAQSVSISSKNGVTQLFPGKNLQLWASVYPSYAVSTKVAWSVDEATKSAGVSVNNSGKVTVAKGTKAGEYKIYANAIDANKQFVVDKNGKSIVGTFTLKVLGEEDAITKIKFDESKKEISLKEDYVDVPLAGLVNITYGSGITKKGSDFSDMERKEQLVWTTSSSYVARVDKYGVVTARNPGKATIKAISNDGTNKSASITIVVTQLATEISISGSNVVAPGKKIPLYAYVGPWDTSNKKVEWTVEAASAGASGVTINKNNGKVSATKNATGTWKVTAKTLDGSELSATHQVTVSAKPIKSIKMDKTMSLLMLSGESREYKKLDMEIKDTSGAAMTNAAVEYYTSNWDVAYVYSDGTVYANGAGTCTITCRAIDGSNKKATCKVTVANPVSSVTIVAADENDGYVCEGSSMKLKAVLGDKYGVAQNQKVKWSVDEADKNKITINNNGVVKAKNNVCTKVGAGAYYAATAVVYAETTDGSNIKQGFVVTILPQIKKFKAEIYKESFGFITYWYPILTANGSNAKGEAIKYYLQDNPVDGKTYYYGLPYRVDNVKCSDKDYKVVINKGVSSTLGTYFELCPDKPTTTKTSAQADDLTKADAIKITAKVKLQGSNKANNITVYAALTSDGHLYYIPN